MKDTIKCLLIASGCIALMACSPSHMNDNWDSSYYWPEDSSAVLITGELNDNIEGYGIGAAQTRHLAIKFNDELIAEGLLSDVYEGQLAGTYAGQPVNVVCHNPIISGQWREVRCSVQLGEDWIAGLTF